MSVNVFARRLTQLEALLTHKVTDEQYDHSGYHACALGHAAMNRNIFRGLNMNTNADGVLTDDDGNHIGYAPRPADAYFGPGAYYAIFQSFGYPSREAVIERIQTFRDNLLAEAA